MRKKILLLIAISLCGCESLPPVPQHIQFGVHADIMPPGFYGVNSETKEKVYRSFNDPKMKAGQCLDVEDYKKMQEWVKTVKEIAEGRCK